MDYSIYINKSNNIQIKKHNENNNNNNNNNKPEETKIYSSPPETDYITSYINKIYPPNNNNWIDDSLILKCQNKTCELVFSFYYRKHHCRSCGSVYCYQCCNKYIIIPKDIFKIPNEPNTYKQSISNLIKYYNKDDKSLVCNECYMKIININNIQKHGIMHICEMLNIEELINCSHLNKMWHNACIYYLSKFRNIQYFSNDDLYINIQNNRWIVNIIERHYRELSLHTNWINIVIKIFMMEYITKNNNKYLEYIEEIIEIKSKNKKIKKISCWSFMCSRKCNILLDIMDYLDIIYFLNKNENFGRIIFNSNRFSNIVVNLIGNIYNNKIDNNKLYNNIIQKLLYVLRLTIKNVNESEIDIKIYNNFIKNLIVNIIFIYKEDTLNIIKTFIYELNYIKNSEVNLVKKINNIFLGLDSNISIIIKEINKMFVSLLKIYEINVLDDLKNIDYSCFLPIIYPFNYDNKNELIYITKIKSCKKLNGISRPLLLDMEITDNSNNKINKKIILKCVENLRKEQIVCSIIMYLNTKLKQQADKNRIEKFYDMPLYDIILINSNFGIIEFVDNSTTLREISDKNYSIQNFILDNKINASISVFEIKDRFMKSLSISSCICYIIGLADRHLDNIMITDNGLIFHIDFGYIHENPKTNILGSPIIKMTEDMIDFLGGNQGILYNKFKKYTVSIFEILRHYNNIIYSFYNILGFENIISWNDFSSKINNRFLHGMDSKDIEISLINEIEKSSSHYHKIYDYIHKIRN